MVLSTRTKGCRLKYMTMETFFVIVSLLSKFLPPLMLHDGSIYIPQMGNEGRIGAFLNIWKDKDQGIHYLMRKTLNIFF